MKITNTAGNALKEFRLGEELGFNYFFREYYAALCYFSFQMINDKEASEEIAGDAFMKLWERHANFDCVPAIRSFLYTTVQNASINWLRQQRKTNLRLKEVAYLTTEDQLNRFQQITETETYREIYIAIKTLPPQCRKIFQMLFLEGKDSHQIAKELNVSISTIYNQKARALTLLRQRIAFLFSLLMCSFFLLIF